MELGVYRPRHPERTAFYRLLEKHFDDYVYAYEERFEPKAGPLRSVVRPTVEAFLDCGRLHGGFARIRCPSCKDEHLLAFSCQSRNFCPSCQAKRSWLFAEKLREEILAPVPHRHFTLSIPKVLRGLFERERSLLSLLSQTAFEAINKSFQKLLDRTDVRPGSVSSIQTFGSFGANWHPHIHCLVMEGVFELMWLMHPAGGVSALAQAGQLYPQRYRRALPTPFARATTPRGASLRGVHEPVAAMESFGVFGLCGAARLGRRAAAAGKTRPLPHPRSRSSWRGEPNPG